MLKLDTAGLPPKVTTILMLRGADLPPLKWDTHPCRTAKPALDQIPSDADLLKCPTLASEEMAAAVRALLYLWNGWPGDCTMCAHLSPERERAYIEALRARQAGSYDECKAHFQQVGEHPVFKGLAQFALQAVSAKMSAPLRRLRELIEFAEAWEPHLFCDIYAQAVEGKFDPANEQAVLQVQCCEFELLLAYCLQSATGKRVSTDGPSRAPERPVQRPRVQAPPKRPQRVEPPADKPRGDKKPVDSSKIKPVDCGGVGVLCPKCQALKVVPESRRGQAEQCPKCGVTFQVPGQKAAAPPTV